MNGWLYGNSGMWTGMAETRQPRPEQYRSEEKWNSFMNRLADQAPPNNIDHIYRHDLETQLEKTTAELIGWLSNWAPVVHQHQQLLKQQQLQLQQQQQMLQQQQEQQEPQQELQQEPQQELQQELQQQSQQQSQQSQASTNTLHSATGV
jgi:WNK lysine deficient protein kinase